MDETQQINGFGEEGQIEKEKRLKCWCQMRDKQCATTRKMFVKDFHAKFSSINLRNIRVASLYLG